MRKIILSLLLLCAVGLAAQVTPDPNPIPKGYTGAVTIIFDATKGNGGMIGATKCYAHTGLITAASTSDTDWKNVIGSWRGATQPQLTSLGNNKWQLDIPNIFTFYGVPETTDIKKLAFVFHDGPNGNKEGKSASGDIFVVLGEKTEGDIWEAVEGVTAITKSRPSGLKQGITYGADGTSVTLCTYAASRTESAKRVFLLGDMTDWKLSKDYQLYKDGNYFWITLTGLTKGKEYRFQYAVERADGVRKQICDLYSEKVLHPDDKWEPKTADPTLISYPTKGADGGYVTVIQPGKADYNWSSATLNFKRPNKNNLIIYETWVLDYTTTRTFKGLMDRLDYIQNLGVNAIELMPITEFEGNQSWGYNPTLYFAMDKSYGKAEDMKAFVDACHQRGIAVILDMVFNHTTGQNPMAKLYPWTSSSPTETELRFNPWFNVSTEVKHDNNDYGEDWNHGFEPAHEMFTRVLQYWLKEYKVDGYRLDLSHGICGRNTYDAVDQLKDYYDKGVKAVSSDAYMILEHWGSSMGSDRPKLINYGMQCWANTNNAYCQTAMGWLKDGDSFDEANQDGYISYCESHDEERMQYKAKAYGNGDLQTNEAARLGRVAENVAFNVLLNGSHMLWQFEEIGYDISIDQNGRTGTKPNPKTKGYFTQEERVDAFTKSAQVITLRTQLMPSVFEGNPTASSISSGKALRTIQWGSNVFVAANFAVDGNQAVTLPSGTWYDYLNGAVKATNTTYVLAPGELKVFTSTAVKAPTFTDIEKRDHTPIENVSTDEMPQSYKILRDGQIYILRGDNIYTITGARIE
ncbi:MAG: alpha-amylase family glycosyl hydrolase [Bacteroidales bacterium]|nr:alpha-amylase family glycosyl hydrolase [Bacteroidales bacterium]